MSLDQDRLKFFASLSHEQSELYRQQNNKNYFELLFLSNNNLEMTEQQALELKSITTNFPSPEAAAQNLRDLNGEICEECGI